MMNRCKIVRYGMLGVLILLQAPATVTAQDPPGDAQRCIALNSIRSTRVVDDSTVLFYGRGDRVYVNRLPQRCPGLRANRTFMYRTTMSQLCDIDVITVLYDRPFGFMPGPSCGLGRFQPISREDADLLLKGTEKPPEAQPVEPADPEPVPRPE